MIQEKTTGCRMPRSSFNKKRKLRGKGGHSMTVNSLAFNEGGPAATSSPTGSNDEQSIIDYDFIQKFKEEAELKIKALNDHYEEYAISLDRAGCKLKIEIGWSEMTHISEVWSVSKSMDICNDNSDTRKVLADLNINYDPTLEKTATESKRRGRPRTRTSSSVPRKRNDSHSEIEDSLFKKPSGVTRKTRNSRTSSADRFRTPVNSHATRYGMRNIATVTPGPNINRPMSVLRRPVPGETAISLSGSPLLVSTESTANIAHVNVPLDSEKVISIFPRDGFSEDELPQLDEKTKSQLQKLQQYLQKMCKN